MYDAAAVEFLLVSLCHTYVHTQETKRAFLF